MEKEDLVVLQFKKLVRTALRNARTDFLRKYCRTALKESDLDDALMIEVDMEDELSFLENHVPMLGRQIPFKNDLLYEILRSMTQRERDILFLGYCCGWSDQKIADHLHLSRSSVQRIRKRTFEALQDKLVGRR
ncbi:MAG: sigma-70 family RNA polymerase sigma factor [Clostridia bacterium]|nr:sigma-70 family RNA polymerase sigma factor [Clostridia bacterium]